MANSVVLNQARSKMLKARAGVAALPKITSMAFGDGGVDASGNVIAPLKTATALKSEVFRKNIDGYEFISDLVCQYTTTLAEAEAAGKKISEIALVDAVGDLVAIKTFLAKGKDADMRVAFSIDDMFDGGDE
ncbi:MAG: phage tail protein [Lachnospiraceae bacterium]